MQLYLVVARGALGSRLKWALPFASCAALGKFLTISMTQSLLERRGNDMSVVKGYCSQSPKPQLAGAALLLTLV